MPPHCGTAHLPSARLTYGLALGIALPAVSAKLACRTWSSISRHAVLPPRVPLPNLAFLDTSVKRQGLSVRIRRKRTIWAGEALRMRRSVGWDGAAVNRPRAHPIPAVQVYHTAHRAAMYLITHTCRRPGHRLRAF